MAKTKRMEYYVDLYPGWQDGDFAPSFWTTKGGCVLPTLIEGHKRVRVVDLPCFGGSADTSETMEDSQHTTDEETDQRRIFQERRNWWGFPTEGSPRSD